MKLTLRTFLALATLSASALTGCGGNDCGPGTVERDGECVAAEDVDEVSCGSGTTLENGACVADSVSCGDGTMLTDGQCVAARVCGIDTTEESGTCVPADTVCAAGTTFNTSTGKCEDTTGVTCGAGTLQAGAECVPDYSVVCAPGTIEDPSSGECVPSARVQVVHMAADPAAATVDVWVADSAGMNAVKLLEDFAFRTATPYIDLLPGTYDIRVAPADSDAYDDTLPAGELDDLVVPAGLTAQIVARGVLETSGFDTSNGDISFTLDVIADALEVDPDLGDGEFKARVLHASTDAPAVDIDELGLINVPYGANSGAGYVDLGGNDGEPDTFDVAINASGARVASYQTSVGGAFPAALGGVPGDVVALVIANGFVDPSSNNDGAAFDLHAVLPNGTVAALDQAARVQVIHNAAGVPAVDIYATQTGRAIDTMGGSPLTLNFREAVAFITVPSGVPYDLYVALQGEMNPQDNAAITATGQVFTAGSSNRIVALGTAAASPDTSVNSDVTPTLVFIEDAVEASPDPGQVAVQVLHGVTDAPAVDIFAERIHLGDAADNARVVDGATYRGFTAPFTVDPADYVVSVTADDSLIPIARYTALAEDAAGDSVLVMASGFFTPANDQNGPAFALIEVDNEGNVEILEGTARLQVIHNSPDPAALSVDVWVNGAVALADFGFRSATPFVWVPTELDVQVSAPGSTVDLLSTAVDDLALAEDTFYIVAAQGVITPGNFTASPDAPDISLAIDRLDGVETTATVGDVAFNLFHGSPDAGIVDVDVNGVGVRSDVEFGGGADSVAEVAANADVTVTLLEANTANVAAEFTIPSATALTFAGSTVTALASGFVNPGAQPASSPALGLLVVAPDGTALTLNPN